MRVPAQASDQQSVCSANSRLKDLAKTPSRTHPTSTCAPECSFSTPRAAWAAAPQSSALGDVSGAERQVQGHPYDRGAELTTDQEEDALLFVVVIVVVIQLYYDRYVYGCFVCMYVCTTRTPSVRVSQRELCSPWNWSYN